MIYSHSITVAVNQLCFDKEKQVIKFCRSDFCCFAAELIVESHIIEKGAAFGVSTERGLEITGHNRLAIIYFYVGVHVIAD